MFEIEAEEIAKDIYIHRFDDDVNYPEVLKAITVGVQKGAEFGYNKTNEWHYVKDGDLPKDGNRVWLYFGVDDYNDGQFIRGRFWCGSCGWFDVEEVIAWKEIVLPKGE